MAELREELRVRLLPMRAAYGEFDEPHRHQHQDGKAARRAGGQLASRLRLDELSARTARQGRGLRMRKRHGKGFVLPLTIFLILGVTAISIGIMFNGKMGRMSAVNYKNRIQAFMAADGMVTLLAQELINGKGP